MRVVAKLLPGLRLLFGVVRREQVGVVGRRGHQGQDFAGRRLQRDDRAPAPAVAALLHAIPCGLLDARVDGGIHVAAARVASGEEVGKPPTEQPLVGSVEQWILGSFQPAAGIAQRIEAGNRRVHRGIGIDPQETEAAVGGDRIRQQLAARSDLAALARVLVEQNPLVARVGAQPVRGEHLSERRVEQQQHDQRHHGHRDPAQGGVHTRSITSVLAPAIGDVLRGRVRNGRRAECEMRTKMASNT